MRDAAVCAVVPVYPHGPQAEDVARFKGGVQQGLDGGIARTGAGINGENGDRLGRKLLAAASDAQHQGVA